METKPMKRQGNPARITNCLLNKRAVLHFLAPAMNCYLLVLTSSYYSHLTSFMMAQALFRRATNSHRFGQRTNNEPSYVKRLILRTKHERLLPTLRPSDRRNGAKHL